MSTSSAIWGAVPVSLLNEPGITLNEIRVFTALSSFQGDSDKCWPSREQVVQRAFGEVDPDSMKSKLSLISRATKKLSDRGYLQIKRRRNQSNLYSVIRNPQDYMAPQSGCDSAVTSGSNNLDSGCNSGVTPDVYDSYTLKEQLKQQRVKEQPAEEDSYSVKLRRLQEEQDQRIISAIRQFIKNGESESDWRIFHVNDSNETRKARALINEAYSTGRLSGLLQSAGIRVERRPQETAAQIHHENAENERDTLRRACEDFFGPLDADQNGTDADYSSSLPDTTGSDYKTNQEHREEPRAVGATPRTIKARPPLPLSDFIAGQARYHSEIRERSPPQKVIHSFQREEVYV